MLIEGILVTEGNYSISDSNSDCWLEPQVEESPGLWVPALAPVCPNEVACLPSKPLHRVRMLLLPQLLAKSPGWCYRCELLSFWLKQPPQLEMEQQLADIGQVPPPKLIPPILLLRAYSTWVMLKLWNSTGLALGFSLGGAGGTRGIWCESASWHSSVPFISFEQTNEVIFSCEFTIIIITF